MSRLKTVILIIVTAPLLIYLGIKGYAYYAIKTQLDDMVRTVSPFAEISYGGIGSSLNGVIRVEHIRILPNAVPEAIRIDAAELHTPGLWFMLKDFDSRWRRGLPERLGAAIRGLHLELDGPIMAKLVSPSEDLPRGGTKPQKPQADGLACSWRALLTAEAVRELGYTTLTYDLELLMTLPSNSDELVLRFDTRTHDLQHLYLETRLAGVVAALASGDTGSLRMRTLSLRYGLDPRYVRKAVSQCAKARELRVDTLLERLAEQDDAAYMADLGFVPGPGIRRALVSLFSHPREIRISARPPWAVDLGTLDRYRVQDLPGRLNLTVSLDQDEIADLSFKTPSLREKRNRTDVAALPSASSHATPAPTSAPMPTPKAHSKNRRGGETIMRNGVSYQRVDKEQLPELVGRDIWVLTRKGMERQGRVVKVEDGTVWLTLRMRGGSMTTSVALAETEQLGLRTVIR